MTDHNDAIVADYLDQVSRAMTDEPQGRRDELIRDLREHIEVRRAEFTGESEAQVRAILERLGDPETIAQAAAADADPGVPQPARPAVPAGPLPASGSQKTALMSRRTLVIIAVSAAIVVLLALCAFGLTAGEASGSTPT